MVDVVRVRKYVRDERAKPEPDHIAVSAPVLDEERDLPAALQIDGAAKQWNAPRAWRTTVPSWRTMRALVAYDWPSLADRLGRTTIIVRAHTSPSASLTASQRLPGTSAGLQQCMGQGGRTYSYLRA